MNNLLKLGAGMALSVGASLMPTAASAYWSLSGCGTSNASAGNICTFGSSSGASVSGDVKASAWANTDSGALEKATLKQWSGGLGVVNANELNAGEPNHSIDNYGSRDVVLFDFSGISSSENLNLTLVSMGWFPEDNDISVLAYTGDESTFSTASNLEGIQYNNLASSGWTVVGGYDVPGNGDQTITTSTTSSYWLVGAYNSAFGQCKTGSGSCETTNKDYVKLDGLKGLLDTPKPPSNGVPVPEPGSLVLLASTLVPLAWRRRFARAKA